MHEGYQAAFEGCLVEIEMELSNGGRREGVPRSNERPNERNRFCFVSNQRVCVLLYLDASRSQPWHVSDHKIIYFPHRKITQAGECRQIELSSRVLELHRNYFGGMMGSSSEPLARNLQRFHVEEFPISLIDAMGVKHSPPFRMFTAYDVCNQAQSGLLLPPLILSCSTLLDILKISSAITRGVH